MVADRLRAALLAALLAALPATVAAAPPAGTGLADLTPAELERRQEADLRTVLRHREGLTRVLAHVRDRADIFPAAPLREPRLLPAGDRRAARQIWRVLLDYTLALDSVEGFHGDCLLLADAGARLVSLAPVRSTLEDLLVAQVERRSAP